MLSVYEWPWTLSTWSSWHSQCLGPWSIWPSRNFCNDRRRDFAVPIRVGHAHAHMHRVAHVLDRVQAMPIWRLKRRTCWTSTSTCCSPSSPRSFDVSARTQIRKIDFNMCSESSLDVVTQWPQSKWPDCYVLGSWVLPDRNVKLFQVFSEMFYMGKESYWLLYCDAVKQVLLYENQIKIYFTVL